MKNLATLSLAVVILCGCADKQKEKSYTGPVVEADLIILNGNIYTMDTAQKQVDVVVVKEGKILFAGDSAEAVKYQGDTLDLAGKTMFPGFHEGHGHIIKTGYNVLNVDLRSAKSYEEVIERVKERAKSTPEGQWILGRNWHQDKWNQMPESSIRNMPTHHALSEAIPNHPVWLDHASSHMGLANAKAMEIAGITNQSPQPAGGEYFKSVDGPTGIFNETAQSMIKRHIPKSKERDREAFRIAIQTAIENGITTFQDANTNASMVDLYHEFGKKGDLTIRLYAMLAGWKPQLIKKFFEKGPQVGLYDNHLTIRSVKLAADGALGSRGAWLIEAYSDAPGEYGHIVTRVSTMKNVTERAYKAGFQVCVHAIGDRANHETLDIFEEVFKDSLQADPRFRIEHAQHLHPDDIPRFAELGVIPAMQAIHMSSDRPWAIDRLGKKRIQEGAYMWQTLLKSGARIVNGTDVPVEPINPIASLYASVTRKTLEGEPEDGYEPAEKMTREQAIKSYTLDAAYGAFMEDIVGSIQEGKLADFTILDKDFMTIPEEEILDTEVFMTIIDGEIVYDASTQ